MDKDKETKEKAKRKGCHLLRTASIVGVGVLALFGVTAWFWNVLGNEIRGEFHRVVHPTRYHLDD